MIKVTLGIMLIMPKTKVVPYLYDGNDEYETLGNDSGICATDFMW